MFFNRKHDFSKNDFIHLFPVRLSHLLPVLRSASWVQLERDETLPLCGRVKCFMLFYSGDSVWLFAVCVLDGNILYLQCNMSKVLGIEWQGNPEVFV